MASSGSWATEASNEQAMDTRHQPWKETLAKVEGMSKKELSDQKVELGPKPKPDPDPDPFPLATW
jgi:hypothetical protein